MLKKSQLFHGVERETP